MSLPEQASAQIEAEGLASLPAHLKDGVTPAPANTNASAIAEAIGRAGMADVAAVLLHILKPLGWLGGQALWMLQPFLAPAPRRGSTGISAAGALSVTGLASLLESEGGMDLLLSEIESRRGRGR